MMGTTAQDKRFPWQLALVVGALWIVAAAVFALLENAALVFAGAALATALIVAAATLPSQAKALADLAFRYRWALAGLLFALCVCLGIHGSSIGIYDEVFPTQVSPGDSTLFGKPRWIRSDEFGVATPLFFSQFFNGYGLFSQQMSIVPTNMVVDYYSPVWSILAIGKPLAWGYLLFGSEVGLSWYWCAEEILIFMTAFEMCLILLQGRRFESMLGALLVWLAPQTQWWVIPHIPIVFLYAMGLFCLGYAFFTAKTAVAKWASAFGIFAAIVGFALSIFPALQVPCAYIIVVLLAVCLFRDRERITFTRRDVPRIALTLLASIGVLAYFIIVSQDGLGALLHTSYPGDRFVTGGGANMDALFPNIMCLFLPFMDATYANNCELATSIHFAPLFLLLLPRMLTRLWRDNRGLALVGIALAGILVVEMLFMMVGFPRIIAEISFLRYCNRMYLVYGWTSALFSVWGISALLQHPDALHVAEKVAYPLLYGVALVAFADPRVWEYFAQASARMAGAGDVAVAIAVLAYAGILACAMWRNRLLLGGALALTLVVAGATVNPIEQGAQAITNHPVSAAITQIAQEEPDSRWLCTDCAFFLSNYVMANGARTLDATNFYPDAGKWAVIDPDGAFGETTNRYANEQATLTDGQTSIEEVAPDNIKLNLNPKILEELDIRYLFSTTDYTDFLLRYGIVCEYVAGQDGYSIYRLSRVDG